MNSGVASRRASSFKTGIDGTDRRRMTVAAIVLGTQPLVHLRLRRGAGTGSKSVDTIDLSLSQANALVRAINAAIEAAENDPRRDGPFSTSAARADAGEDEHDDGPDVS